MDFGNQQNNMGNVGAFNAPNPYAYPSEVCEECGSEVFVPGVIFKKIPGVLMGAGVDVVPVPIKVAVCAKCGTLSPLDKEKLDEETRKAEMVKQKDNKTSNLII